MNCIIMLLISFQASAIAQEEKPFWRQKPRLYQKILKERRIVVSSSSKVFDSVKKNRVLGAGVVQSSLAHTLAEVGAFENLNSITPYFKKVVHKKEKKQLYMHLSALGYQARMLMAYNWKHTGETKSQLELKVLWGGLIGSVAHFEFIPVGPNCTEVSIWSSFPDYKFPWPSFLTHFTLEVIAEKVGQKMRTYIEDKNPGQKRSICNEKAQ